MKTLAEEFNLTPKQSRAVLGAIRAVIEADGQPRAQGVRLLEVAMSTLALSGSWHSIPACSAQEVAEAFESPMARRILCDALIIPACIESELTVEAEAVVTRFADALGVKSHWVELLPALRKNQLWKIKQALFRRSPDAKRMFSRTWKEEGLWGIIRTFLIVSGFSSDNAKASRFRALEALPVGTLGRTYFEHCKAAGIPFPGEPKGMPDRMLHHDLLHIINDYSTQAEGECQLAGFYAAFVSGDAFTFMVTVLATFQLGLKVSPAVVMPTKGAFDPQKVVDSFLRGRRLSVDVMGEWNFWELMPLSILEVRQQLGLAAPQPMSMAAHS